MILQKVAYTPETFTALLGDALALRELGDVRFLPLEQRCMGLVPDQFKALLLRKPAG